jgi:two-component system CheB/CheR fusion protein
MLLVAAAPSTTPRPVVLLVDDHHDTRLMYAEFLGTWFEVAQASDGAEALALIERRPPDILITDLSLPGMDGFELIAAVRARPGLARLPIMSLSGYGGHSIEERAREVGCDRVLQKPCLPDALGAAALELLRSRADRDRSS